MKWAAALANGAWQLANTPAWQRFRRALQRPADAQRAILERLLRANSGSVYGVAHGFGRIQSYAEYSKHVPLVTYEELEPWIGRIMRGEPRVLTCEPVTRLLPTSGSTGGRKLIPFTAGFQRELNAAIAPWIVDLFRRNPGVSNGPAYWSISPALAQPNENSAVPIGFDADSAYLGGFRQRLVEATLAVPPLIRAIPDVAKSRYLTLLALLREPELRLISVWHPSFLALLLDAMQRHWAELLEDLERGNFLRNNDAPPAIRGSVGLGRHVRRAKALRLAGPQDVSAIWPKLCLVSCWGDGQAELAMAELQQRLPFVRLQAKGLLATEAFVSIPFGSVHPVAVTSHFFEFMDSSGNMFLAHELQQGQRYEVIVSAGNGLWRYRLGDLVEVDGSCAHTPSLRFLGRHGSVSDICGEKLAEAFVTRAISDTCSRCQWIPGFAMLAPERDATGGWRYTLFTDGDPPEPFIRILDMELRSNPHFALCRDLGQLGAIQTFAIGAGAYEVFCRIGSERGCAIGDIKPQALSSRTDWREKFQCSQSTGL